VLKSVGLKWAGRIALLLLALVILTALVAWLLLRGSLPRLDGELALPGLSAPVVIQRDRLGVVTIDAANEADATRALGYVHAQERYFEMDLLRRTAAGELAALFGPIAVDTDRRHRVHRMRARAQIHLDAIVGDRQAQLQAYVEGVNAGLHGLKARPWSYLLLRRAPEPWQPADTPLVGIAMYFDLQDEANARELALWRLRPHLPEPLYALLTRDGTRWDAPLLGKPREDAELPDAAAVDLRKLPTPEDPARASREPPPVSGSNNFAVAGVLTADGRAIVADDMHLGLRAPNIWFRVRLRYADERARDGRVDVSGFSLPGLPMVVVGSNRHVAWGFTNSYGDYLDWKRERPCTENTPSSVACSQTVRVREVIDVAGADPAVLDVEQTDWGPVMHRLPDGSALTLRWTAHLPDAINLGLGGFAAADSLDDALALADRTGIPTQNLVIGDRSGRIAWRLLGPIASRRGGCSTSDLVEGAPAPPSADEPQEQEAETETPDDCEPWRADNGSRLSLQSPTARRLWTANNRTLDKDALRRMGDGGFAHGARAQQIRNALFSQEEFTERDLLRIQLDDRALLLTPWWKLLRERAAQAKTPALSTLAAAAQRWEGRASPESVSYRVVRAWRLAVHARIADGLTAPARAALGEDFVMPDLPQFEGVVWPLVTQRPRHLLPRRFTCAARPMVRAGACNDAERWDALFEDAAREVRDELAQQGPLAARSWGERNTADICHPMANAIPFGRRLLCMPPDRLPGDSGMPRVQGPDFGASERMVVSPGHEADGIIHMPGGQSGHFLSPFWGAGHDDWVHGRPTPFLPGKAEHKLTLQPVGSSR
jgi:penicillin amidase